jgi:glycosyltransferase involved in cell wall biosynthesis
LADLAVFPSLADETFGVAICEAMACGRAVISTRVGGIPELVNEGESGILVEPKNWQELGEEMARLLSDPHRRFRLGETALDRVKKSFTWEKVARRLRNIYQDVLSHQRTEY